MISSKKSLLKSSFSCIYIEKQILNHPNTKKIIRYFKNSQIIIIDHYKDVFSRGGQSFILQKQSSKLILARSRNSLIYKGAEVCQNFGNKYFYYTSSIMNCVYNCEYCYLQGMYPSSNIVIFVNLEDTFFEIENMLKTHEMYLCISYDTDLLGLEKITGFVDMWIEFCKKHSNLTIEIRTKSASFSYVNCINPIKNVIFAWTLSPQNIISKYEQKTSSLKLRLENIKKTIDLGWKVRICFDPLLYVPNWEDIYFQFINQVFQMIPKEKIYDVSIGVFRMNKEYLKKIKKERPLSYILNYPFECQNGVCTYSNKHIEQLINFVYDCVSKYIDKKRIYI